MIFISPDTGEIVGTEITYLDPCTGSGGSGGLSGGSGGSSSSEGSGSSGGLGNGGVLTGGGVGTTGSPTYNNPSDPNVLITSPVGHNGNSNHITPNPCEKLKDLFNTSKGNIRPIITNELRPNIAVNPSGEKGHALTKNSTGTVLGVPILPSSINVTQVPTGGYFYCALHTHPLEAVPMFSFSDVITLNSLTNGSASFNQGLASFLLVCQDDNNVFQTYAIVVDPDSFNESIDQFMTNPENIGCTQDEIEFEMNQKFGKEYNIEYNSSNPNYERVFLKNMSNSNVSLYKANSTLTNWSKLSLNTTSATATVKSTPCN